MKLKIFVSLLIFLFALPLIAAPPHKGKASNNGKSLTIDNTTYIDVNRILMFVTNHGNFGRDLGGTFGHDYGTWYPYTGDITDYENNELPVNFSPNYASGLWIGGIDSITGDTLVTISEYSSEYIPGMIDGTKPETTFVDMGGDPVVIDTVVEIVPAFMDDNVNFRNYKLYADSLVDNPNQDYLDYMAFAVPDQNAPVWTIDNYIEVNNTVTPAVVDSNTIGEPMIRGDQFIWSVYNDADPAQHANIGTQPLGLEIRQSVFGWKADDAKGDMVFVRYRIFNKGLRTIEGCNFSLWCDPDLGQAANDFVGCDTLTDLGFVWNETPTDQAYTNQGVPSMGFDFLQGPLVLKSDPSDPDGKMWGQSYPTMTNLRMESFNKYSNGTDPDDAIQAYNYMNGLTRDGGVYAYEGQNLKYVLSGDPVTGEGDIDAASADRRWMQSTGPITFRPGDSTEIYAVIVMGQSADNISSIIKMRSVDEVAQKIYDNGWNTIDAPATPVLATSVDDNSITIGWSDTSEVDPGSYPFEGYVVYQGETKSGPWVALATYDLTNNLVDMYDWKLNDLTGALEFVRIIKGNNTGLKRNITLYDDVFTNQELNSLTEYIYRITAYSFSEDGVEQFKIPTSSAIVTLTPHAKVQDVVYEYEGGELMDVVHTAGASDGVIRPQVIFPDSLTGDTYQVVFVDTIDIRVDTTVPDPINFPEDTVLTSINIAWHLINITTGDTLIAWESNQDDVDWQEGKAFTEGFLVTVTGPAIPGVLPGFAGDANEGWRIPSGARRFTWANSDFGFEGFEGCIGWGGPNTVWGTQDPVAPSELVTVNLVLATVDEDGNFDVNDENVSYGYRYLRGPGAPAQPEFAPYIITSANGSYGFQEYAQSIPLSAWNMDTNPPTRLALGYLENNAEFGTVDGKYWPNSYLTYDDSAHSANDVSAVSSNGPREWLFIFKAPYTGATADAAYSGNAISDPIPIMYWSTVSRRGNVPFSPGGTGEDQFEIIPSKVNSTNDVFTFTAPVPDLNPAKSEDMLDAITTVPNPFYLFNGFSDSPGAYVVKFHHLPTLCTITIYNLAGELIKTIDKNDASTAIADWDVLTENGLPVASGIYVYVVDAPGYGQKVGKMAIMVEQEVLQIY